MKKIILLTLSLFFLGCAPRFTIPDEPKYRDLRGYQVENLVCFDAEGMGILQNNIHAMKEYGDKLRSILEGLKK